MFEFTTHSFNILNVLKSEHKYSFTVTQHGPPAFCSEKGLEGNHNILAKNTKEKEKNYYSLQLLNTLKATWLWKYT